MIHAIIKEFMMQISKEKERLSERIPIQAHQNLIHATEISGATLN